MSPLKHHLDRVYAEVVPDASIDPSLIIAGITALIGLCGSRTAKAHIASGSRRARREMMKLYRKQGFRGVHLRELTDEAIATGMALTDEELDELLSETETPASEGVRKKVTVPFFVLLGILCFGQVNAQAGDLLEAAARLEAQVADHESRLQQLESALRLNTSPVTQSQIPPADSQLTPGESPGAIVAPDSALYFTQPQLRQQIANYRATRQYLAAEIQPPSAVWQHLMDGNHAFTADQVNGLSQTEALWLHSAHHEGVISPTRTASTRPVSQPAKPAVRSPPVILQNLNACPNGQCAQQQWRWIPRKSKRR
ncbi:hypothetical protein KOR42_45120 [Thalassoglobus neptunius]|uniref:Uncharacterized protein n=1 Tax=Thalassoglobus neptunius TaxID=1938619 RepID=A0A5C5VZX3_9PLAN|nr:hypothetical protein [Thalassoglobus neptunius]TWT43052.1 hypothetical protein KOR42_45120 [Thalassoglobus neptunius]